MTKIIVIIVLAAASAASWYWRARLVELLKGWRTVIWNLAVAGSPVLLLVLDKLQEIDLSQWLTPLNATIAGLVIGGVGIWLRLLTTAPIGQKDE